MVRGGPRVGKIKVFRAGLRSFKMYWISFCLSWVEMIFCSYSTVCVSTAKIIPSPVMSILFTMIYHMSYWPCLTVYQQLACRYINCSVSGMSSLDMPTILSFQLLYLGGTPYHIPMSHTLSYANEPHPLLH